MFMNRMVMFVCFVHDLMINISDYHEFSMRSVSLKQAKVGTEKYHWKRLRIVLWYAGQVRPAEFPDQWLPASHGKLEEDKMSQK